VLFDPIDVLVSGVVATRREPRMTVESVAIVVRTCWERCGLSGKEALAQAVLVAVAVAVAGVLVVAVPATVAPKR
jgi:hypothetical protein